MQFVYDFNINGGEEPTNPQIEIDDVDLMEITQEDGIPVLKVASMKIYGGSIYESDSENSISQQRLRMFSKSKYGLAENNKLLKNQFSGPDNNILNELDNTTNNILIDL